MRPSYTGLTPAQVTVARGLLTSTRWTWGAHTVALRPDGALLEISPSRGLSREQALQEGLVPLITDPVVLGHLLAMLEQACGQTVSFSVQRERGPDGALSFTCTLSSGDHRRAWTGACVGEAVAQALIARWRALEQTGSQKKSRPERKEATGWAQARLAQARAG